MHVEFRSGGKCPAYNTKCDFCERLGHFKVKCRAFRKQKLVPSDRQGGNTKNTTGDEVSELGCVWDSSITGSEEARGVVDNAGHHAKVMQWDSGDLSLIKGIMMQGEAARGQSNQSSRMVLKHMRYDRESGHFVPTEKRKQNRVEVGYTVDRDNHRILQEMLNNANGFWRA